ncbi:hypothetical protein PVAP13_2KG191191 [Panicum virgatum]|uniref:Uncharacterized protein n=1 Tax=Panicum virgatum TaxID=38727 RepID=A0A8T0W045_PANVG|nr:hypothetical protein PVAP13_2KG191191 [Panicum virgatum]
MGLRGLRRRGLAASPRSLETDDVAGVLPAPISPLLSSSLTSLVLRPNEEMERFTEEQEDALPLLTSLQQLDLSHCYKLQCLPAGLQRLTNLKRLLIPGSPDIHSLHKDGLPDSLQQLEIRRGDIRSLPKDGLPNSLRKLKISGCSSMRSLPKDGLPNSLEELEISFCPSIRSLAKGGLPSSLRLLDVRYSNSEELTRQCRTLIGTIPIVRID